MKEGEIVERLANITDPFGSDDYGGWCNFCQAESHYCTAQRAGLSTRWVGTYSWNEDGSVTNPQIETYMQEGRPCQFGIQHSYSGYKPESWAQSLVEYAHHKPDCIWIAAKELMGHDLDHNDPKLFEKAVDIDDPSQPNRAANNEIESGGTGDGLGQQ